MNKDLQVNKIIIFINGLIPFTLMLWDAYHQKLGANPQEFLIHTTGSCALIFLIITLSITPLRKITKWHNLTRYRRMLGLFAFFYAFLHFLSYAWLTKFFDIAKIISDVLKRQYIAVGMVAFVILILLAITSANRMVKRLGGQRWRKLHRFAYLATILGAIHYWMSVKIDTSRPLIFMLLILILLGYRYFTAHSETSSLFKPSRG